MDKKRQLHKYGFKVLGFAFDYGRDQLGTITQNDRRLYLVEGAISLTVITNQGELKVTTAQGFVFDGRSGPKIIDWYVPNLGSFEERLCWFVHDCNGYGLDLSFEDTNVLLFAMLRDLSKYRTAKANVIQFAVSLSKSWYGEPKDGDWCRCNLGKVTTVWIQKK